MEDDILENAFDVYEGESGFDAGQVEGTGAATASVGAGGLKGAQAVWLCTEILRG